MNPLRTLSRSLATLAFGLVAVATLFGAPAAVVAQRVQDVPATVAPAAGTHQSVPVSGPAKTAKLTPAQLQQELKFQQAVQQQQLASALGQPVGPKSPIATRFPWLTHAFAAIFYVSAVGLVLLLAFQTTKQEGLSGTIGGRVEAAYRPRLGFDQQLQRITSVAAITMVIFATIVSLTGI